MKVNVFGLVGLLASVAVAMPELPQSAVKISQDGASDLITIGYTLLGEPAVVTCSVETNGLDEAGNAAWFPLPTVGTRAFVGDLGMLVSPESHTVRFRPSKACDWTTDVSDFRFTLKAWPTNSPPDWMVVDAMGREPVRYCVREDEIAGGISADAYKTRYVVLRRIPAAGVEWIMGSPLKATGESGYGARSFPVPVALTADYYCAIYELTALQAEYAIDGRADVKTAIVEADLLPASRAYSAMRGTPDGGWLGWPLEGHAVKSGSGFAAMRERTRVGFDYLTAAQWEFASRAGSSTSLNSGHNIWDAVTSTNADDVAWYVENSGRVRKTVGLLKPNDWKLYDMHGNAWEFVLDWFARAGSQTLQLDPVGPQTEDANYTGRTVRGGSYEYTAVFLSNGIRYNMDPAISAGVRLWAPCAAVR